MAEAKLYANGDLFWFGTVSSHGDVVADKDSPEIDTTRTRDVREWAVSALCSTGGSAGCYGAWLSLGLVSLPVSLGCAAVCGLIAALGCTVAGKKVGG